MSTSKFQAATYDFWNTLVAETTGSLDRRRVLWTDVLLNNGYDISQNDLDAAFAEGWNFFDTNWRNNTQTTLDSVVSAAVSKLPALIEDQVRHQLIQELELCKN